MDSFDVAVIGAGHQGLVAATILGDAGLRVIVLEAQQHPGGAVASAELTVSGLVHDVFATNMNLFLGSPFYAAHSAELASAGLAFAHSTHPYASTFPGGRSLLVSSDQEATRRMWVEHDGADAAGWDRLRSVFDDFANAYLPLYTHPFPSRHGLASLRALRRRPNRTPIAQLTQVLVSSTRALGDRYFHTSEAKSLLAAWGMHLDYAPDVAGGAVFPLLECYGDMLGGMSIVEGGAGRLPRVLAELVSRRGGEVQCGSPVTAVETDSGGVTALRVGDERIPVERVISTLVLPQTLGLLPEAAVPIRMAESGRDYRFGPGTFMLHLALDGPIPWVDSRLGQSAYVHIGPYVDDMARTYAQSLAGTLPDEPLLVVGQTSVVDPTRSHKPAHQAIWVQARTVPSVVHADSKGEIVAGSWDDIGPAFAERVLAKLERYAPGIRDRVIGRTHMTPADLERADANLVGGDSVSGSHQLDQFIGLRPSLEMSRYRTPISGLYLAGAGTWPGGGVNAISGQLAAETLLRDVHGPLSRIRSRLRW